MRLSGQAGPACSWRSPVAGCRMSNQLGRKAGVAVLDLSGQSRGDLLQYPGIAVGIAERGIGGVTLSLRIWPRDQASSLGMVEYTAGVVEWLADRDPT